MHLLTTDQKAGSSKLSGRTVATEAPTAETLSGLRRLLRLGAVDGAVGRWIRPATLRSGRGSSPLQSEGFAGSRRIDDQGERFQI